MVGMKHFKRHCKLPSKNREVILPNTMVQDYDGLEYYVISVNGSIAELKFENDVFMSLSTTKLYNIHKRPCCNSCKMKCFA